MVLNEQLRTQTNSKIGVAIVVIHTVAHGRLRYLETSGRYTRAA